MNTLDTLIESLREELLQVLEAYPADPDHRDAWRTRVDHLRGDIDRLKLASALRKPTMTTADSGIY